MNIFKVLAIKHVSFTDDQGNYVEGDQLWLVGETKDPVWNGREVLKVWLPVGSEIAKILDEIDNDFMVIVEFNRRGKALSIEVA